MNRLKNILTKLDELKARLDACRPLSETQLQKIERALFVEYTYESNRIEGNTLTLKETALVIEKGITISGKSLREHLEAINHYDAIKFIKEVAEKKEPFNERSLKDIHALILRSIDRKNAGKYRTVNVKISGSRHIPPDALKVQERMDKYFRWYERNRSVFHPVLLSSHLHEKLVTIHPFIDGNGRTARLVMNLVLIQHGYTVANLTGDSEGRLAYYNALEKCQTEEDCSDFHLLVAQAAFKSMDEYLKIVKTGNERPK